MSENKTKNETGAAIINDKIIGIVCPHCGKLIELNILKSLRAYLNKFNDNFKAIRDNASEIDVNYVINKILRGNFD